MNAHGHGPGEIAADGSPVELYAALPENPGAAALVHVAVPAGASILELGAGTGRVTHPLPGLGHPVVAVDGPAAMPARIRGAETVRSRIQDLRPEPAFGAALLMSYPVSYGARRRCRTPAIGTSHQADG